MTKEYLVCRDETAWLFCYFYMSILLVLYPVCCLVCCSHKCKYYAYDVSILWIGVIYHQSKRLNYCRYRGKFLNG